MQILTFNTGRAYTDQGQRIAATQLESGHIILVDADRHLDVMLPAQIEFTQADIMWAYDLNMYVFPSEIDLSYGDYYEIVRTLTEAARAVKGGTK